MTHQNTEIRLEKLQTSNYDREGPHVTILPLIFSLQTIEKFQNADGQLINFLRIGECSTKERKRQDLK